MAKSDTIINHRDMTSSYILWGVTLSINIAMTVLALALQYTTPFASDKALILIYIFVGLTFGLVILGALFKWVFRRESISWIFATIITIFGLLSFLLFGWNVLLSGFFLVAFICLFAFGPYLHFE
ncbi:MAG: hypothetical protein Q8P90_03685 [bacterium]|nr:hypothetical protein [bacterium]